jgi:hypothetical protein
MKHLRAGIALLALGGCTAAQQAIVGDIVPVVVSTAALVDPAITPALTATAKLGCDVQTLANGGTSSTDKIISTIAGDACAW